MADEPRLVIGVQPVREAIAAHGNRITRAYVARGPNPKLESLAKFAKDHGIRVERVTQADLDRISRRGMHQGVAIEAPPLELVALESIEEAPNQTFVVLDGIVDPQNFGAVIRSSVAFGATAVAFAEHGAAPLTPATFRASAGAVEHVTLSRVRSLPAALAHLGERGAKSFALEAHAEKGLPEADLSGSVAIVLGSEESGLHRATRKACAESVKIPMAGKLGSFNASVAIAIALYEVHRQRR